ncbi:UDP-N-acetylmuramate dehydrogenase [Proteiniphilum sp. X52]|uniref:UDP-N-acetylmuramate dehydrogenase n=1 Tax=Proteiniphilum sp. X52 TaxID=2382159 RepID=UPI000F0A5CD6|nr:UDP-N-acetylmuramate dehydrogenase [Proteiniphilum sp. X52]RNC65042.1 UDP-N-acetylmuramate dehydrogenase [Proteiniphilum sp. X52]
MIIKYNVQLQPYNSFRTKASAKILCEPQSAEELSEIIRTFPDERKLVLGNGFNLFFTKDFEGLVIKPAMRGIHILTETDRCVEIEVGAAEDWDQFVAYCVENSYAGIENLSLIPGSVGASPVQNIGAYGTEVMEVITKVKAVELQTGNHKELSSEECGFGYRDSIFKRSGLHVITSVVFTLEKSFQYKERYIDLSRELEGISSPTLAQVRNAIIRIRNRKLPDYKILPNAGSFFKNPVLTQQEKDQLQLKLPDAPVYNVGEGQFKTSAAFLIDKAGYKGKRRGMVGTSTHHSLIIVNYGTENGREIVAFMHEIQQEVRKQFGIMLEPEVRIY